MEKRWGEDCLNWVQWAPWHRYKGDEEEDGEVPEGVPADEVKEDGGGDNKVFIDVRSPVPRDFYLTKEAAKKFGYTRGCGGCQSWFKGLGRAVHTEACRERFRVLHPSPQVRNCIFCPDLSNFLWILGRRDLWPDPIS